MPSRKQNITGWQITGESWRNGQRIAGYTVLFTNDNLRSSIFYGEEYSLERAVRDAKAKGYDTREVEVKIKEWVASGKGATFSLRKP
jgi:hypothetical protein